MEDEFITPSGITLNDNTLSFSKRVSNHLLRFRQIQSEMQVVLNEKHNPTFIIQDLKEWQKNMHERIQKWYNTLPSKDALPNLQSKSLEAFELTLHRALFYLYHPSLNIPTPPETALLKLTDAATHMIKLYWRFFRDHVLTIYWQAVENLYSAGNALLFTYVSSSAVRNSTTLRDLESLVHTCSSVLWGMVEHFPDFQGRRDAFDLTAKQVLADISRNLVDREDTSHSAATRPQNSNGLHHVHTSDDPIDTAFPSEQLQVTLAPMDIGIPPHTNTLYDGRTVPRPEDGLSTYPQSITYDYSDLTDQNFDWTTFDKPDDFLPQGWM